MVCEGVVFGGGKNGSCQRVARATGKLPPSFPGRRAAPMTRAEIEGGRKALTQRNATRGTICCNAAHFYALLNCAGGRMEW